MNQGLGAQGGTLPVVNEVIITLVITPIIKWPYKYLIGVLSPLKLDPGVHLAGPQDIIYQMTAKISSWNIRWYYDKLRGSTKNLGFPLNYLKCQVLKIEPTKSKGLGSTGISKFLSNFANAPFFADFLLGILGTMTCHQLPPGNIYVCQQKNFYIGSNGCQKNLSTL